MTKSAQLNRQSQRSRQMLQDALIDLLEFKPFAKISISEIADHADLARSTFYAHFDTKDDLLASLVDTILEPFFAKLLANLGNGAAVQRRCQHVYD